MPSPAPKKSLGQHWLRDEASLQAMCDAVQLSQSDTVLEIGPGLGTLTKYLTEQAEYVIATEFDETLARTLPSRVSAANLEVVCQDILQFDFSTLPFNYKVVANIPYYLTSNLIRVMSETPNRAQHAALLIQKEVAERAAAEPGSMSILSVTAQFYWQLSLGPVVPAALFEPPPKVDSQILILQRRDQPLFPDINVQDYFRLVKAGFSQRRKTLLNSLSSGLHLERSVIADICNIVSIDPGRRAQTLSLEEWYWLYQQIYTKA